MKRNKKRLVKECKNCKKIIRSSAALVSYCKDCMEKGFGYVDGITKQ